jgi:lipopolysaccharide export system permease protein
LNLLDRHIFKSVFASCAVAVLMLAFIIMLKNVLGDLMGPMLAGQLPVAKFLALTALLVPFAASYALPMGMLTGILLTLGRLSADNEITAMRAAGISMPRLTRPIFLLAGLAAALGLYVNFEAMPHAKVVYERDLTAALHANPLNLIVPRTFIRQFPGYVLYIGDKQEGTLKDFWLWKFDANHRVILFERAASGRVDYDEKKNQVLVTLANFQIERLDEKNPEDFTESPSVATAEVSDPVALPLDSLFGRIVLRQKLAWMTYAELRSPLGMTQALKDEDGDPRRAAMKVALTIQEKFTLAFAVLSFALIGVPLGIQVSRRETSANLGLAVTLALAYYFLTVMVGWLDRHPEYRPDLLLWAPNLIFIGLGLWLFRRLSRR